MKLYPYYFLINTIIGQKYRYGLRLIVNEKYEIMGYKEIAKILNIPYQEFIDLIISNGARKYSRDLDMLFFKNRKQVIKVINKLEPYLLIAKLSFNEN